MAIKTAATVTSNTYKDRFLSLYKKLHDSNNGYFSAEGVPYHAPETMVVEATDYGHVTTSEAFSYYLWLEAMNSKFTGDWTGVTTVWNIMEKYIIPTDTDQPVSGYDASKPATYAGEWELPSDYPSKLEPSTAVGKDPIYSELKSTYGTESMYGMHWLLDADNWYGYGTRGDGVTKPSLINTFQRGKQESTWETVTHPSWEAFKWGGTNGFLDLFTGDSSYSKQWRYTNAPDADARVVQAMYWADKWAKEQGNDVSSLASKAAKMGDYLRYCMFDKYFKKLGCQDKTNAGTGYDSCHHLLSWYYAWGGGIGATWSWKIGCSHNHFGYQNPMTAWILSANSSFKPKSANGASDWAASLTRQIEFFQWLQSAEGAIAGGATNSYNGRYETYPTGTPTFYGMAYIPHPVYEDPGSNRWFGMQSWGMQRVAEYYYETGNSAAQTLLAKWVKWIKSVVTLNSDGTFTMPTRLSWSGQPDTWTGTYTGNSSLHVSVLQTGVDLGSAASLANALSFYSAGTKLWSTADDDARVLAKEILDRMWSNYVDTKGLSLAETMDDFHRMFDQEVYIPTGWTGKMANGDVIKPGVKFIDIRSKFKDDSSYATVKAAVAAGNSPVLNIHRFWSQCEIAIANGTYANLFNESSSTVTVSVTAPTEGQSFTSASATNPITITATASTTSGTISKVAFYANGTKVGEATASPYSITWYPTGYASSSDGLDSYAITAIAVDSNGTSATSAAVNIKVKLPIAPAGKITLQAYNASTATSTNSINPHIKITNSGSSAIDLSTVKIRYYYTINGEQSQSCWCDSAAITSPSYQTLTSNVTGSFVKMATAKTNADYYLEISFTSAAGSLAAGAIAEVQMRFAKSDWSNYTQSDDYSFNSSASSYADNSKITVYISSQLITGTEP
jgi:hypothetical protein